MIPASLDNYNVSKKASIPTLHGSWAHGESGELDSPHNNDVMDLLLMKVQ